MRVLGINDGHNAAACLYEDGRIVAALQEERLRRVKNWSGMPVKSIEFVLKTCNLTPGQVDAVALNGHHAMRSMTREELMEDYAHINDFGVTVGRNLRRLGRRGAQAVGLLDTKRRRIQNERIQPLEAIGFTRNQITFVDHHTAHASAAYYGWGNFLDDVLVLTADGSGDGICATVSIGRNGTVERLHAVPMAHSLGNIYAMVTFLMGMVPLEHEYKLMGLAPYADPKGAQRVFDKFMKLIRFDTADPLGWEKSENCPETYCSYNFFRSLLERDRFDWIAGGLQRFTETVLTQWVKNCVQKTGISKVALGGGIFMNVKANKLIMELPEVKELFIYPSCGDETNAMGAAYYTYALKAGIDSMKPLQDLYWGQQATDSEIEAALQAYKFSVPVRYERIANIERKIAELLAEGNVVARHAGREEFGARSLGNRAILADPRKPQVVRIINEAIKARDYWMPFATSIIGERASDYIVNPKKVAAPYMILTFDTTDRRDEIFAGTHPFDFTIRPQIVEQSANPSYHKTISEFDRLTGIGGILNTSFNLHGYPIASSPNDSLEVLDRSGLNVLAIENWLIQKV